MSSSASPDDLKLERQGAWQLRFMRNRAADGSALGLSVELSLDGDPKGRLSTGRADTRDAILIERLRERALAWIEEYEGRDHSGSTGFADL